MTDIRALNIKRGTVKAQLTRFRSFLNGPDHTKTKESIQTRLKQAEKYWDKFEDIQTEIEQLDDSEEQTRERLAFESNYFDTVETATMLLNQMNTPLVQNPNHNNENNGHNETQLLTMSHVKLPTINLPTFTGSYEEWMHFYDMFHSLIHTNNTLNPVQKFHYLTSTLKGEAAHVIASLETSASNYEVAWKLLKDRFDNPRLIVNNHVKTLFDLPIVIKESHVAIRQLLSNVLRHLRALQTMKQPIEQWDTLLIHLVSTKLDVATKREWETSISGTDLPTMDQMIQFLTKRAQTLESIYAVSGRLSQVKFTANAANLRPKAGQQTVACAATTTACQVCRKSPHPLFRCYKFLSMPANSRLEEAKKLKACLNCLRSGHSSTECRGSKCQTCGKLHNTLLHTSDRKSTDAQQASASEDQSTTSACSTNMSQSLLPTALVKIIDDKTKEHIIRVLLDTGSQSNFMTQETCNLLNLKTIKSNLKISGLNETISQTNLKCSAVIRSLHNNFCTSVDCYVIPKIITKMPTQSFDASKLNIPYQVNLADEAFNKCDRIDMLLGAPTFFEILLDGTIKLGSGNPIFQNTQLGWIAAGTINVKMPKEHSTSLLCVDQELHQQLERFWKVEEPEMTNQVKYSKQEEECELHFTKTLKRDKNGRFIVTIPFSGDIDELGDTKEIAMKRVISIETKFKSNNNLKEQYIKFMSEYEQLGHMTKLTTLSCNQEYYLPHHPVIKKDSLTTKLRVVFDASAVPANGKSLNQLQKVGPTIQNDLFSIVIRFRTHAVALTADVEKMYRQVLIDEEQRPLQTIFWRSNQNQELQRYQLNTITYGMVAAPFLAIRCLNELAIINQKSHARASEVIQNDFYVDDMLSGANSIEEALQLHQDVSYILKQAQFKLQKWTSNNTQLLSTIDERNDTSNLVYVCEHTNMKTLGIVWNPKEDFFQYKINFSANTRTETKRSVLSQIAKIYDPLGWLSPVIINAKVFMQKLWKAKLSWDDALTGSLHIEWNDFMNSIQQVNKINIPRYILMQDATEVEMHCFCDASERAYAACVYLKAINDKGKSTVHLVCSKTKVAPLKTISVPRLELCGAVLLTKLAAKTKAALKLKINRITYWTDSTIVLCWIQTSPHLLKSFVANRISHIQQATESDTWRHVPTQDNPADIASRGVHGYNLETKQLWWNGPTWLLNHEEEWPNSQYSQPRLTEVKQEQQTCCFASYNECTIFNRFSSLTKIKRVVSYIQRFKRNCTLPKDQRQTGPLTLTEINAAFNKLIRLSQRVSFYEEIKRLETSLELPNSSKLLSLNPFLDADHIMRVGGRLGNSDFDFNKRHPIILTAKHKLTELLFTEEHVKLLHAGPQLLLNDIREKFWPIGGRNLAKNVIRNCMTCFRVNPKSMTTIMGDLPGKRLQATYPFQVTGVDYAGPVILKDKKGRNAKTFKAYICVFVCFVTKAMHLELVTDLTTNAFIMTLRRFVARRGKPAHIYSDNGTNFIGANNQLREFGQFLQSYESDLVESCTHENIEWHFIPAHSPHFGGLWEAGVKSTKFHLRRVLGNAAVTFEEFYSVLTQIEAILNSRPICPMSNDPTDLQPLTPAHFLIGRPLTAIPDPNVQPIPENRLSIYQRVQQLTQHFWSRWAKEYVSELQQRHQWKKRQQSIQTGTMVLIKDDNLPPLCWMLGRVVETHPGRDDVIRVVTIRTPRGTTIRRSITKLCPLPHDEKCSD